MKLKITKKHIKEGKKKNYLSCPIAVALQERFANIVRVLGTECGIGMYWYPLPLEAQNFIKKFDAGKKVVPFNFIIKGLK